MEALAEDEAIIDIVMEIAVECGVDDDEILKWGGKLAELKHLPRHRTRSLSDHTGLSWSGSHILGEHFPTGIPDAIPVDGASCSKNTGFQLLFSSENVMQRARWVYRRNRRLTLS